MALPNFFDRVETAASQVLSAFQMSAFKDKLEAQAVGIAFDRNAAATPEGRASLDLLVRLFVRLYPKIAIVALDTESRGAVGQLGRLAKLINPEVKLSKSLRGLTACVTLGFTAPKNEASSPLFFIGSDAWRAKLSNTGPVGSGNSANPFGAGAAACFAASNVFRAIFLDQVVGGEPDAEIDLNLLTYARSDPSDLDLHDLDLGVFHLVGLGAIGNGALWALSWTSGVRGKMHGIDHDRIDLSNLQRYVLSTQNDVDAHKVALAERALAPTRIEVLPVLMSWQTFVSQSDWRFERVAVALDSEGDRITVQGALPKWIVNAWTQSQDLGVSRHAFGDGKACLACLYLPEGKTKDEHDLIAEELGIPGAALQIKGLLQNNQPVGAQFVQGVADAFGVPVAELMRFASAPVRSFYQKAVCGGLMLKLTDGKRGAAATVPMAFQSALAGIMLAGELIKHAAGRMPSPKSTTRVNMLRPLAPYLDVPRAQDRTGRCICCDGEFQRVYRQKYEAAAA